jgi:hypothetical protein
MDGTVLAWKRHYLDVRVDGKLRLDNLAKNILQWLIVVFTAHSYVHLAVEGRGSTWESTGFGAWGAKRTEGILPSDEIWDPVVPFIETQTVSAVAWAAKQVRRKRPYNIFKFVLFPLRGLWRALRWAPFDSPGWGEVCFTFVDEFYLAAGRDVVKGCRGYVTAWEFLKGGAFSRRGG